MRRIMASVTIASEISPIGRMIETWLRLHVLEAVQARLQQPAAEFSALDILLDVQCMTGVRLSASEYDIATILKAVPCIMEVARSEATAECDAKARRS